MALAGISVPAWDPRPNDQLIARERCGSVRDVVSSNDPAQTVFQCGGRVPALGGTVVAGGPQRPLQIAEVVDVLLGIDFVVGDGVVQVEESVRHTWDSFANRRAEGWQSHPIAASQKRCSWIRQNSDG